MEDEWSADRARLRYVLRDHPAWSRARLAQELARSHSWVEGWRRRLGAALPDDEAVLSSRSRARLRPPSTVPRLVVADDRPDPGHAPPGATGP